MKTFIQFIEEETEDHVESLARLIHGKTSHITDEIEVETYIPNHVTAHPAYKKAQSEEEANDFGDDVRKRVMELRKSS